MKVSQPYISSWVRGDPLFKYVDECDAHFLEKGSVRIGTLRGYSQLESSRADREENTSKTFYAGTLDQSHPKFDVIMQNMGFKDGGFNVGLKLTNCGGNIFGPDLNCFCASDSDKNRPTNLAKPQSCFRIDDLVAWIREIRIACPKFLGAWVRPVTYGTRHSNPLQVPDAPDPFLKPVEFAHEQEIRMIWNLGDGILPAITDTPSSPSLARLMTRVF